MNGNSREWDSSVSLDPSRKNPPLKSTCGPADTNPSLNFFLALLHKDNALSRRWKQMAVAPPSERPSVSSETPTGDAVSFPKIHQSLQHLMRISSQCGSNADISLDERICDELDHVVKQANAYALHCMQRSISPIAPSDARTLLESTHEVVLYFWNMNNRERETNEDGTHLDQKQSTRVLCELLCTTLTNIALCHHMCHDYSAALSTLTKAMASNVDDPVPYLSRALVLRSKLRQNNSDCRKAMDEHDFPLLLETSRNAVQLAEQKAQKDICSPIHTALSVLQHCLNFHGEVLCEMLSAYGEAIPYFRRVYHIRCTLFGAAQATTRAARNRLDATIRRARCEASAGTNPSPAPPKSGRARPLGTAPTEARQVWDERLLRPPSSSRAVHYIPVGFLERLQCTKPTLLRKGNYLTRDCVSGNSLEAIRSHDVEEAGHISNAASNPAWCKEPNISSPVPRLPVNEQTKNEPKGLIPSMGLRRPSTAGSRRPAHNDTLFKERTSNRSERPRTGCITSTQMSNSDFRRSSRYPSCARASQQAYAHTQRHFQEGWAQHITLRRATPRGAKTMCCSQLTHDTLDVVRCEPTHALSASLSVPPEALQLQGAKALQPPMPFDGAPINQSLQFHLQIGRACTQSDYADRTHRLPQYCRLDDSTHHEVSSHSKYADTFPQRVQVYDASPRATEEKTGSIGSTVSVLGETTVVPEHTPIPQTKPDALRTPKFSSPSCRKQEVTMSNEVSAVGQKVQAGVENKTLQIESDVLDSSNGSTKVESTQKHNETVFQLKSQVLSLDSESARRVEEPNYKTKELIHLSCGDSRVCGTIHSTPEHANSLRSPEAPQLCEEHLQNASHSHLELRIFTEEVVPTTTVYLLKSSPEVCSLAPLQAHYTTVIIPMLHTIPPTDTIGKDRELSLLCTIHDNRPLSSSEVISEVAPKEMILPRPPPPLLIHTKQMASDGTSRSVPLVGTSHHSDLSFDFYSVRKRPSTRFAQMRRPCFEETARLTMSALFLIQRWGRGYSARRHLPHIGGCGVSEITRRPSHSSSFPSLCLFPSTEKLLEHRLLCARRIQRAWRKLRHSNAEDVRFGYCLPHKPVFRCPETRRKRRTYAAILIQKHWKGAWIRQEYARYRRKLATVIAEVAREHEWVWQRELQNRAATRIQCVYRGSRTRRQFYHLQKVKQHLLNDYIQQQKNKESEFRSKFSRYYAFH